MATQQNFNDDEDEENQNGEQVLSNPTGGQGSAPGQGASQQSSQPSETKSGSWTNLMDYVGANQGNDAKMGEAVKGSIDSRANQAQSMADDYSNRANEQIESGTVRDQGIVDSVKTNAADVAKNQREQFDKQWNAYYQGPNQAADIQGYGDTGAQYKAVQDRAQAAQSHEGRKTLLEDQYNRPTYTAGEKNLDSYILGSGSQGRQVLNDINQQYGGYASGWDNLVDSVSGNIQQGRDVTQQTQDATRGAVNQGISGHESQFGDYESQLQDEYSRNAQKLAQTQGALRSAPTGIAGGGEVYRSLGIDPDVGSYLANNGFSMDQIIKANEQRKLGDLVSQADVSNYQALLDLGGVSDAKYSDFSKSGASSDPFSIQSNLVSAGKEAKALQEKAAADLIKAQASRDKEYEAMLQALNNARVLDTNFVRDNSFKRSPTENTPKKNAPTDDGFDYGKRDPNISPALLGISDDDLNLAAKLGVDPTKYLSKGSKLTMEDMLANSGQLSAWGNLLSQLSPYGFDAGIKSKDQDEGLAYNFDMKEFKKALKG